jgi:hypothetical protein
MTRIHYHFNQERHPISRGVYPERRLASSHVENASAQLRESTLARRYSPTV